MSTLVRKSTLIRCTWPYSLRRRCYQVINAFRFIFEDEALFCNAEEPIDEEGFATNARIIQADAKQQRVVPDGATH